MLSSELFSLFSPFVTISTARFFAEEAMLHTHADRTQTKRGGASAGVRGYKAGTANEKLHCCDGHYGSHLALLPSLQMVPSIQYVRLFPTNSRNDPFV